MITSTSLRPLAAALAAAAILHAPPTRGQELRSELRDQGPVYFGTVIHRSWPASGAMKGIVVKLGTNDTDYVCYDEDLLRVSLVWTGAFMNFPNNGRDRIEHPQPAEVAGVARFGSPSIPGVSLSDSFEDPRPSQQGPLPKSLAHYKGVYLHRDRVILSYTLGNNTILESPDLDYSGDTAAFTRTIELGPTPGPVSLLIAAAEAADAPPGITLTRVDSPTAPVVAAGGITSQEATPDAAAVLQHRGDEMTAVVLTHGPQGASWQSQDGRRIVLKLPALKAPTRLKLVHWTGSAAGWPRVKAIATASPKPVSLKELTQGGPSRWGQAVETKGVRGTNPGPYQVDPIGEPANNPWKSKTYLSGFDFFPDGRAAVAAFHGDVWIVSGLDETLQKVTWRRFATGLFQPLGLKIVDGIIHVTCRDGLVRLRDLNGDGEADLYENFNNDTVVTPNYHEFCLDLDTDSAGNFYYAKGAPWPPKVTSPHQGTALKVSRDGSTLEVIATGLRAPNGLAVGPQDQVSFSDNEGHYIPTSKISYIQPGNRFYGMVQTAHRTPAPTTFEQPLCWIPKSMDNSSGGQVWVNSDRWGPFKGSMLFMSYGKATLFSVMQESVNGQSQGGVVALPFRFPTGVMRARFHPGDGQLYLTGLRGWQTAGVRDGGFFRVRRTEEPLLWPLSFHARKDGIEIGFSDALNAESAKDLANWSVEQWNYVWSPGYGSPEVTTADPRVKGHDTVQISRVEVSADGKSVFLVIPEIKPVMQMRIRTKATGVAGTPLDRDLYLTLHQLAEAVKK